MGKLIDLTGQRFGRLLVCRKSDKENHQHGAFWICKCDCEPKDKVATFIKILEFNCPKLQTVTLDDKREVHNALTEKLRQMSEEEG